MNAYDNVQHPIRQTGFGGPIVNTALTRTVKGRAVAEMAHRLASAAIDYDKNRTGHSAWEFGKALRRRHDALVRLAMARTVD